MMGIDLGLEREAGKIPFNLSLQSNSSNRYQGPPIKLLATLLLVAFFIGDPILAFAGDPEVARFLREYPEAGRALEAAL
jgi:hypothetical protein